MKKHILLGAALLSLFAASCSNEDIINNDNEVVNGKTITLNASINNRTDSRMTYKDDGSSKMSATWSTSESFTMYQGTSSTPSTFSNSADNTGKFTCDSLKEGEGTYYAVYGENISNTDGTLTIDLSQAQVGTNAVNGIKEFMLATANALTSETTLTFDHKLTVLKLTLTLPVGETGTTVNKVTVSGLHNKATYNLVAKTPAFDYGSDDSFKGDITATNGSTGFAITDHQITAYVAVFPEKVSSKQVKITAKVGDNEYAYNIEAERELAMGKVTPVVTTLYWTKNLKAVYTTADYYAWDAIKPYSLSVETPFAGSSSVAQYSCKYTPDQNQVMMYLGAGVYWDNGNEGDNQQTYQLPNGSSPSHAGLWVMKKEYISGFSEGTANAVTTVSTDNPDLWHKGRPAAGEIGKYFFLPATGHYWGGVYYDSTDYWLSVAFNEKFAGRLSINENSASYNGGTTGYCCLPMVAE